MMVINVCTQSIHLQVKQIQKVHPGIERHQREGQDQQRNETIPHGLYYDALIEWALESWPTWWKDLTSWHKSLPPSPQPPKQWLPRKLHLDEQRHPTKLHLVEQSNHKHSCSL